MPPPGHLCPPSDRRRTARRGDSEGSHLLQPDVVLAGCRARSAEPYAESGRDGDELGGGDSARSPPRAPRRLRRSDLEDPAEGGVSESESWQQRSPILRPRDSPCRGLIAGRFLRRGRWCLPLLLLPALSSPRDRRTSQCESSEAEALESPSSPPQDLLTPDRPSVHFLTPCMHAVPGGPPRLTAITSDVASRDYHSSAPRNAPLA